MEARAWKRPAEWKGKTNLSRAEELPAVSSAAVDAPPSLEVENKSGVRCEERERPRALPLEEKVSLESMPAWLVESVGHLVGGGDRDLEGTVEKQKIELPPLRQLR